MYTYVVNNPLKFVDPSGYIPTPLEAAYMAQAIYTVTYEDKEGPALQGGWILKEIHETPEGLKIGIYSRAKSNGVPEYVLVNKGTSTNGDWADNLKQLFDGSTDMKDSRIFAKEFVKKYAGYEVTMVGHSKGGAEAIFNALLTDTNAITFNTATPNAGAYFSNYRKTMTHYVVKGEALNELLGTPIVGKVKYLPEQNLKLNYFKRAIENHSMEAVINALKMGGYS